MSIDPEKLYDSNHRKAAVMVGIQAKSIMMKMPTFRRHPNSCTINDSVSPFEREKIIMGYVRSRVIWKEFYKAIYDLEYFGLFDKDDLESIIGDYSEEKILDLTDPKNWYDFSRENIHDCFIVHPDSLKAVCRQMGLTNCKQNEIKNEQDLYIYLYCTGRWFDFIRALKEINLLGYLGDNDKCDV